MTTHIGMCTSNGNVEYQRFLTSSVAINNTMYMICTYLVDHMLTRTCLYAIDPW